MIHKMRNTHSKMLWRRRQHCIYSPFIVVVVVVAKPAAPSSAAHFTADDSPTTKRKTKTVCSISWSVCDEVLAAHLTWDRKTADAKPHRITTKLCALRTHTHTQTLLSTENHKTLWRSGVGSRRFTEIDLDSWRQQVRCRCWCVSVSSLSLVVSDCVDIVVVIVDEVVSRPHLTTTIRANRGKKNKNGKMRQ